MAPAVLEHPGAVVSNLIRRTDMTHGNGSMAAKSGRVAGYSSDFPQAVASFISTDGELLRSLVALRRLGSEGAAAVDALLSVKRVAKLRLSWELWAALVEGDGGDPEDDLLGVLPVHALDAAALALWGSWQGSSATDAPQCDIGVHRV
jgi:hypothetical protein